LLDRNQEIIARRQNVANPLLSGLKITLNDYVYSIFFNLVFSAFRYCGEFDGRHAKPTQKGLARTANELFLLFID
jgi:hypothetical protein